MSQSQNNYALLRIEGKDACKFLQGQFTCDVNSLTEGGFTLGAHCNAKGRIMSLFRFFTLNSQYYMLMPADVIQVAYDTLKKYALFSKVNLAIEDTDTINNYPFTFSAATQHASDIKKGIPRLYPDTIGQFLPHYINLPQLGGVSFTKGCYTGQEIIARMQHRGNIKQRMYPLNYATSAKPGEKIIYQQQTIGTCVDKESDLTLAIIKDDIASELPLISV